MPTPKPTSTFINVTVTLFTLLTLFTHTIASEPILNYDEASALGEVITLEAQDEIQKILDGDYKLFEYQDFLSKAQKIVIELHSDNTKSIIDRNEFVLVLGYVPWSTTIADLMPKFAGAATLLNRFMSTILIATLNFERYPKVAEDLGMKTFPTLLLFINGSSIEYSGEFSPQDMVIWTRISCYYGIPITGFPVVQENSEAEEGLFESHNTSAMGLFEKFESVFHHLMWGARWPYKPEVAVKSLSVNNFYIKSITALNRLPTAMVTLIGSLKISIYNPSNLFGIHVTSTPINLLYSDISIATGQLKKYYQPRKSHQTVTVDLVASKVPLYTYVFSLEVFNKVHRVPLTLEFQIRARGGKIGRLARAEHRIQVSCLLIFNSSNTDPIIFI